MLLENGTQARRAANHPLAIQSQYGGAAMEYIMVSLFGTFVTIAALSYIGKVFEAKLQVVAQKLGVEPPDLNLDLFSPNE